LKILITGASGFLGSYVLATVKGMGYKVYATSRRRLPDATQVEELKWIKLDLLDFAAVRAMMKIVKPDLLIHLAWDVEPGNYWNSPENLAWAYSTVNLLKEFQNYGGTRAVLAGSCAEYSWEHGLCDEIHTPLHPSTIYGACKDIARRLVLNFHNEEKVIVSWARIFYPYGPGESNNRLIPQVIKSFLERIELKTSLTDQYRDYIHGSDVARALVHLILNSKKSDSYNICSGNLIQISTIIHECKKHFSYLPLISMGGKSVANVEPALIGGSNAKLKSTGWNPVISFAHGIEEYIKFQSKQSYE
jgi:nucleoside-diphosphate-sugar epimerase